MVKPNIIINGRGFLTEEEKIKYVGKKIVPLNSILLYNRTTKKKIKIYSIDLVKKTYLTTKSRKRNIYIPSFGAKPRVIKMLKDYMVHNLTEADIRKKYKVSQTTVAHYLKKYRDPTKPQFV